jgi:catechol 2,3-dioxygenase-like lactoylglutathione lyase family enzyme
VALNVRDLEACERFYVDLLGMRVEWRPDRDNLYLTSGSDNLALHRLRPLQAPDGPQRLDHIGIVVASAGEVDLWFARLRAHGVQVEGEPRTHRDGARSFYCQDPEGNRVQVLFHPPLAAAAPASTSRP